MMWEWDEMVIEWHMNGMGDSIAKVDNMFHDLLLVARLSVPYVVTLFLGSP